jgi:hypothetical protein
VTRARADLADLYTAYLAGGRSGPRAAGLASALATAGYRLEAAVVSGAAGRRIDLPRSVWHGRRLWTGGRLPDAARAGDVWPDTCQLHRWQYAAFLALAQLAERPVQLGAAAAGARSRAYSMAA